MTGIDLERLARAVHLEAERLGEGTWLVTGGAEPHTVSLEDGAPRCGCADATIRGGPCKHVLRIALAATDPAILAALRLLVPGRAKARR